ncbi:MAG: response regulator, partial [Myxococcales bacterium]|nr:response regulator [Myxococcales bacterium]
PGLDVAEAGNVRDAKALIRALDASLLISDLDLPDGSGVELAAELDRSNKRVPIIFVSAFVREYQGRLPDRPDIDVYEKPVTLGRLRELVEARLFAGDSATTSPFNVADYIQLAAMGRRSVLLEVRNGGSILGSILIRGGEVWAAHDKKGDGLEAFRRLAFARNVVVACRTPTEAGGARSIQGSAESVLLEAAQARDEGRSPVSSAPPAPSGKPTELDERNVDGGWDAPEEPRATDSGHGHDLEERIFREHYERGVDALLTKDYRAAFEAFQSASDLRPGDRSVAANLKRLRELGHAGGSS